jgi:hypothetical protein
MASEGRSWRNRESPAPLRVQSLGFLPNLMAIFANNATVLEGYLALGAVFEKAPLHQERDRSFCWLRV